MTRPDYQVLADARAAAYSRGPDGVIIVTRAKTILDVNEPAEMITGLDRRDLVGQPLSMLVPEAKRGHHETFMETFFLNPDRKVMGQDRDVAIVQRTSGENRIVPVRIHLAAATIPKMGLIAIATIHQIQHHWSQSTPTPTEDPMLKARR